MKKDEVSEALWYIPWGLSGFKSDPQYFGVG